MPLEERAVSARPFEGVDARLSRYAYLVSLLPVRILRDIGATVPVGPAPICLLHPDPADHARTGLLVRAQSTFAAVGAGGDEQGFEGVLPALRALTKPLWPTLLEPLHLPVARDHVLAAGHPGAATAWSELIEQPWVGRSPRRCPPTWFEV